MRSWRIDHHEINNVLALLNSGFPGTQERSFIGELEQEFAKKIGTKYAITFVNGTATLHASLVAAGVQEGDEVIVPPLTMASTCLAVFQARAIPVFADIDPETFIMDVDAAENMITPRTRAIMPVSLYGLPVDSDAFRQLATRHQLAYIEDNAQTFLGRCREHIAGSNCDIASFSFQNSKHITCGEGGIVTTSDAGYAEKMRRFSSLGYGCVSAEPGQSKIDKKMIVSPNFSRHVSFGFNYRMSELCAAVACAQLDKLDYFVEKRIKCAMAFDEVVSRCAWLKPQQISQGCKHVYWTYAVRLATDEIKWQEFYDRFIQECGDGFYGAWRLNYQEPYLQTLQLRHNCPNAEKVQPQLMQFKTNYCDADILAQQQEALARTIQYFDGSF